MNLPLVRLARPWMLKPGEYVTGFGVPHFNNLGADDPNTPISGRIVSACRTPISASIMFTSGELFDCPPFETFRVLGYGVRIGKYKR